MKKICLVLVLLCLFLNSFSIKVLKADETDNDDTIVEVDDGLTSETESDDDIDEIIEYEQTPSEESDNDVLEETSKDEENIEKEDEVFEESAIDVTFVLPENFVLDKSVLVKKQTLINEGTLEKLNELEEGSDYKEKELVFTCNSEDYANMVANIYHATLESFSDRVAVIKINDEHITVYDAVEASLDLDLGLPLVSPNYITRQEPVKPNAKKLRALNNSDQSLPIVNNWETWVNEVFNNPDPYLITPSADYYQWQHDMVHTYAGWNATMGSPDIKVAVIDTSINQYHEDLYGKVLIEDVGCGTYYGNGHGTHVAGIIAASVDNGVGGAGIAPDVTIIGINVFRNSIEADNSDITRAIYRAVDCGASVINLSLGSEQYDEVENDAIQHAFNNGVVVVAAAGNSGSNIKFYPACYENVVSVASVTSNGSRSSFSNYGPWITVSAPGTSIYSTITTQSNAVNFDYSEMSGTSMAAPIVTGAVALYISKVGNVSPKEMTKIIKKSVNPSSSSQMGAGIIDIEKMFNKLDSVPYIKVFDKNNIEITDFKNPVEEGSYVLIECPSADEYETILYTINGKNPSIKNGMIVNGEKYVEGSIIDIDDYEKGKTIKINVAVVNGLGVLGKVKSISIKTPVVKVQPLKIKTVSLNDTKVSLNYSKSLNSQYKLDVKELKNINNDIEDLNNVEHIWISSNPKVVSVDDSGMITATGPGTAKVTLSILDGSKKTASCSVTVVQIADGIEISGLGSMSPGTTTTYKAVFAPTNVKNKKVEWSIDTYGNTANATVNTSGKVVIPKNTVVGSSFVLVAKSLDGSEVLDTKLIKIEEKAKSIKIETADSRAVRDTKNNLKSINLFTVDVKDDLNPIDETIVDLYWIVAENNTEPIWTSSNPKVATVENGTVKARSAGKTTITCKANDGSNKKATVTVNVIVPISSLTFDIGQNYCLSEGSSINLSKYVGYGTQYGKPSQKKVDWSIVAVQYYVDNDPIYIYDQAFIKKYFTISKIGVFKVNSKMYDALVKTIDSDAYFVSVILSGKSVDGTNYEVYHNFAITKPLKYIKTEDRYFGYSGIQLAKNDSSYLELYSDQPVAFEIKSSNGNVVGASISELSTDSKTIFDKVNGKYQDIYVYVYYIDVYSYDKKGIATITIKALDGSNKTTSTKVYVK